MKKINVEKKEEITKELEDVQKRYTARTIEIEDVVETVSSIEKNLSNLLPKKDWKGLKFQCDPHARKFPASYQYTPESTQFVLSRGSKDWFITEIYRNSTHGPLQKTMPLNLDEKEKEIVSFVSSSKNW